jgi:hypothetical protein
MFQRGIDRGELRPDFRIDFAVDWFAGLMVLWAILDRPVPGPEEAQDFVDFMLDGILARPTAG